MLQKLPKHFLLRRHGEMEQMRSTPSLTSRFFRIHYYIPPEPRLAFTIIVPKRFGNSPQRHRFKRIIREALRTSQHLLPTMWILLRPRFYSADLYKLTTPQIAADILQALKRVLASPSRPSTNQPH